MRSRPGAAHRVTLFVVASIPNNRLFESHFVARSVAADAASPGILPEFVQGFTRPSVCPTLMMSARGFTFGPVLARHAAVVSAVRCSIRESAQFSIVLSNGSRMAAWAAHPFGSEVAPANGPCQVCKSSLADVAVPACSTGRLPRVTVWHPPISTWFEGSASPKCSSAVLHRPHLTYRVGLVSWINLRSPAVVQIGGLPRHHLPYSPPFQQPGMVPCSKSIAGTGPA